MSELRTQLAEHVDSLSTPVDVDQLVASLIEGSTVTIPSAEARRPRILLRPVWVAALAVAAVVASGLFAWLLRADQPATQPAAPMPPVLVKTVGPNAAGLGTMEISIRGWEGVEGYQLLATVWEKSMSTGELVGGAFWTLTDSDPFSATDTIHPPVDPTVNTRNVDSNQWGLEDYQWTERSWLEPGQYEIVFWANPHVLHPYGSHIPASPVERSCSVTVEVGAREVTSLIITGVPSQSGECPVVPSSRLNQQATVTVSGFEDHAGWDMAGVLFRGTRQWAVDAIGGFSAQVTSDDYTTTEFIKEGATDNLLGAGDDLIWSANLPFPFVKEQRLAVKPGHHTLVIWASNRLSPYSHWYPGVSESEGIDLMGCIVGLEVSDGVQTRINVDGSSLKPTTGDLTPCTTLEES